MLQAVYRCIDKPEQRHCAEGSGSSPTSTRAERLTTLGGKAGSSVPEWSRPRSTGSQPCVAGRAPFGVPSSSASVTSIMALKQRWIPASPARYRWNEEQAPPASGSRTSGRAGAPATRRDKGYLSSPRLSTDSPCFSASGWVNGPIGGRRPNGDHRCMRGIPLLPELGYGRRWAAALNDDHRPMRSASGPPAAERWPVSASGPPRPHPPLAAIAVDGVGAERPSKGDHDVAAHFGGRSNRRIPHDPRDGGRRRDPASRRCGAARICMSPAGRVATWWRRRPIWNPRCA
jgi:hypothetical protein